MRVKLWKLNQPLISSKSSGKISLLVRSMYGVVMLMKNSVYPDQPASVGLLLFFWVGVGGWFFCVFKGAKFCKSCVQCAY